MNSDKNTQDLFLDPTSLLKKSGGGLIGDVGKLIAIITLIVACLVTFTDISFYELGAERLTSTLILMLVGAYLMFFSLEESGERQGERTEEFSLAKEAYKSTLAKIKPSDIIGLEKFLKERKKHELLRRREEYLSSLGLSAELLCASNAPLTKEEARARRGALRISVRALRAQDLLERDSTPGRNELYHITLKKLLRIAGRLIPTSACIIFTASVMLSTKGELTAGTVIESLLRLATLPIVGFRGYSFGYRYTKHTRSYQISEKTRILESFLATLDHA